MPAAFHRVGRCWTDAACGLSYRKYLRASPPAIMVRIREGWDRVFRTRFCCRCNVLDLSLQSCARTINNLEPGSAEIDCRQLSCHILGLICITPSGRDDETIRA
jgi:hypothetical protein